jgi:carbonic anhydrase
MSEISCCCETAAAAIDRRRFIKLAAFASGATLSGFVPRIVAAAGHADALLLSCIDYRLTDKVASYMEGRGLKENYGQVILAGASLGAVTSKYPDWQRTFDAHLGLAIQLHGIRRVIALDHRDCGAYRLVFGKDLKGEAEKALHATELHRLARRIHAKHPKLEVEMLLMNLDGQVETIA